MNDLFEMGWNDTLGNLRRAKFASRDQKLTWVRQLMAGQIGLPRHDDEYVRGVSEAGQAFIDDLPMAFKGPDWVVEDLEAAVNA